MENLVQNVPLSQIKTAPQVRTKFNNLLELGEDIKKRGLLQPIVVTPEGDGFKLIIGERRFRAMQLAGCESAPAIIAPKIEADDLTEIQLIENIQREDLPSKDLIDSIKAMYDKHGTVKAVADRLKKTSSWVSKKLAVAMQAGPLTMRLIENEIKDGELLYSFAKLETIETACALELVDGIVGRTIGRKEVQAALRLAAAGGPVKNEPEDTTADMFPEEKKPSIEEVMAKLGAAQVALSEILNMSQEGNKRPPLLTMSTIENRARAALVEIENVSQAK